MKRNEPSRKNERTEQLLTSGIFNRSAAGKEREDTDILAITQELSVKSSAKIQVEYTDLECKFRLCEVEFYAGQTISRESVKLSLIAAKIKYLQILRFRLTPASIAPNR